MNNIIPIILAGGTGTRLWPLSRKSYPKQFLKLLDDEYTMLQKTYKRIENLDSVCRPIVICNEEHRFLAGHQMKEINIERLEILLEPEGRNTTPAITVAALKTLAIFKDTNVDPILLILSSDHQIKDIDNFQLAIKNSIDIASKGNLAIFGIEPTFASTGYGYIKSAEPLEESGIRGSSIDSFVEKPDLTTAYELIKDKRYTWNSGMFVFKNSLIIKELNKHAPLVLESCKEALGKSVRDLDFIRIEGSSFSKSPNIPIDIAVMEKTNLGLVLPLDAGWSDIGLSLIHI